MDNRLIPHLRFKRLLGPLLIVLLLSGLLLQSHNRWTPTIAFPNPLPVIHTLLPLLQQLMTTLLDTLITYPLPSLSIITVLLTGSIYHLKNQPNSPLTQTTHTIIYKPKITRNPITRPAEQQIHILANTTPHFFQKKIDALLAEYIATHNSQPFWIRYSMTPHAISWNLGALKATHHLHVYGEEPSIRSFLSSLHQTIQQDINTHSSTICQLLAVDPPKWSTTLSTQPLDDQQWPTELQQALKKPSFLEHKLHLLAGVVSILSILTLLKRRRQRRTISRDQALQTAIKSMQPHITSEPRLTHEQRTATTWIFTLSDYQVHVNEDGTITAMQRVTPHD